MTLDKRGDDILFARIEVLERENAAMAKVVEAARAWAKECRDDLGHDKLNLTWLCQALAALAPATSKETP